MLLEYLLYCSMQNQVFYRTRIFWFGRRGEGKAVEMGFKT